ncbi:hypothetical protein NQ314_018499 [Rhamnusium bicolor]|uniref:Uncharacterized protein n=1 Tax=Rhamnusium bicolor TaxID=1586634 RepID=A0AAV8WR94_9CUCU|nr:hypothetical protein NQ314_018499 [Rhamnusium bicolor]
MKIYLTLCLVAATVHCFPEPQLVTQLPGYTQLTHEQIQHLQQRGFGSTVKSFRPTVAYREVEDDVYDFIDSEAESSQNRAPTFANQNYPIPLKTTPLQPNQNYPVPVRTTPPRVYASPTPKPDRRPPPQQQYVRREGDIQDANNQLEEEEEIEEEPDRLSLLLPQSKFNCISKHTGYYADEGLGCEVHLICMPPGGDNICDKSSDYHFVNDFLYKPVNLEEHQHKPNVTLRYSDRYYPDAYRPRYNDEEEEEPAQNHHQHSVRVPVQQRLQQHSPSTIRPQATIGQVFRSPEEINISLQQRRPVQYTTAKYNDY